MHWLARLFRKDKAEQQLDAELQFHLDKQIADGVASGLTREEAKRRANLAFGALESAKEQARAARRGNFLDTVRQDLVFSLRTLRKSPGFTAVAILTLALGIGANTALFSLLDGLVLRDLAVPHPEQLVRFGVHAPDDPYVGISLPIFEELSRAQTVFSQTFAFWGEGVLNVEINGALSRGNVWALDGNFLAALAAVPQLGRLFGPEDGSLTGAHPPQLAVLGFGFWQRCCAGSADVLGKTIWVEGVPFLVIGVSRANFTALSADDPPEVMIPLSAAGLLEGSSDLEAGLRRPDHLWLEAGARLKEGVTLEQARAQIAALWPGIQKAIQPTNRTPQELARFVSLQTELRSGAKGGSFARKRFENPLYAVLAIAGMVLLLASVNLASLTLARATSRSHEIGVRLALGAGRGRVIRQMLTESVTLALLGALGGVVVAYWSSQALADFILSQVYIVPASLNLSPDWRILTFTAAVATLTGVLFGLAPSWRASREDPQTALRRNTRTVGQGTGRLGQALVVVQVALSVALVSGAGLFIRSLQKLRAVDPGFRTTGLLEANLNPKPNGYKGLDMVNYYRELTTRINALPGVAAAGIAHTQPGNLIEWTEKIRAREPQANEVTADFSMLMPDAFRALGINLLRGRTFTWQDNGSSSRVAVLSENLAQQLFPPGDAIGKHVDVATEPEWQDLEIVGVVSCASLYDFHKHQPPTLFVATTQYGDYMGWSTMMVQTSLSPLALDSPVRKVVDAMGHEYVTSIKTVRQGMERSMLQERVTAMLSAFFGGLALVIAAIGLYGQMAYSVTRRTREIGIRVALGARRVVVQRMVLREALGLAVLGVICGVVCVVAVSRYIASLLFGLSPRDPGTLLVVAVILLAVSAFAAYFPARRAMRVDPMIALRHE